MESISQVESAAASLILSLRTLTLSPELSEIRDFLFPDGFTPIVQLEENGRKKRSSAAAWNWNPNTGEIHILLEPTSGATVAKDLVPLSVPGPSPAQNKSSLSATSSIPDTLKVHPSQTVQETIAPEEIVQCCQALDSAEKTNRQFIALKWFRDTFLPTVDYPWALSTHRRQQVLSQVIAIGCIEAKRIANPKSEFPTMTLTLNRTIPIPGVEPRFQPIVARGEPVSTTLLRDRGSI